MAPLRASFLGGSSFGALMAADGVGSAGTTEGAGGTSPAPIQSESAGPAAASSADSAAGAGPSAAPAAAAVPAADISAAPAAPEGAAPAQPESATSLLAEAKAKPPGEAEAAKPDAKPEGDKPADKPAPAEPKKDDAAAAAKPEGEAAPVKEAPAEKPPAQTYEAFKLPEGIKLDADKTKSFTSILDNPEFKPQDRAQALIDLHLAEVTRIQKEASEHQQTVWKQFQQANVDEIRKDPEYGGNRIETSLGRAKWVIEQYGGDAEQQKALLAELSYTGMGNSVRMTRLLNNVAELLSEGEVVPAAPIAVTVKGDRKTNWYGGSMKTGNGKTA